MVRLTEPINLSLDLPDLPRADTGGGGWTLFSDHVDNFAWVEDVFTPAELDAIINIGNAINKHKGETAGDNSAKTRDSTVSWLFPNELTSWVFARLSGAINEMNARFFRFDLFAMEQGLQFTHYEAPGQHYTWHIDRGMQTGIRKLSLTLQLSDPETYEGGDLELWFGGEPIKARRKRGLITLFPSYAMHRVTPVTTGERYSLVAWIGGPPFK